MTVIYLQFPQSPAPEQCITFVTEALQKINPDLSESKRTEDSITFTSTDHDVDIYGDIFKLWLDSEPPVIDTWRMVSHG
ncbi:hypothetical protein N7517_006427 [Penicillium concentricum]|uniref:Uncharacterized protein n=1 Tax=Penicillium concentricum TaxID=293559 RepID=A0A9W9S975_9EURO|nr:uncharacterized protein N7517_006427 [Penicillium concentricum]KAJ5374421.1 hypothetical protein N7517_006427 [Penicillium concentricum]